MGMTQCIVIFVMFYLLWKILEGDSFYASIPVFNVQNTIVNGVADSVGNPTSSQVSSTRHLVARYPVETLPDGNRWWIELLCCVFSSLWCYFWYFLVALERLPYCAAYIYAWMAIICITYTWVAGIHCIDCIFYCLPSTVPAFQCFRYYISAT